MDLLLDINDINQELFDNITLQTPSPLQGGTYLAKLTINDNPILLQTPKSKTKKGIVTNNKRNYCDLLFEDNNHNFHNWIDAFETTIRNKIYEKGDIWFTDKPSLDDIDYNWNTSLKIFKKHSILRTFLGKSKNINDILSVYDSDQNKVNASEIKSNSTIVSIIEVTGLKFSSSSFHLEYCIRQIMIIKELPLFNKCMINLTNNKSLENSKNKLNPSLEQPINNTIPSKKVDISNIVHEQEIETENKMESETESKEETNFETESTSQDDKQLEQQDNPNIDVNEELDNETNNDDESENTEEPNNESEISLENNEENKEDINNDSNEPENVESPEKNKDYLEKTYDLNDLSELNLEIPDNSEVVNLKNPSEVYLELYKKAKEKARQTKIQAIQAYLELNNIKKTYMIEETESSDDEEINELMAQ